MTRTGIVDEIADADQMVWDDVVDIVCIGRGAAVLAAAVGADRSGMSVCFADAGRVVADAESLAARLGVTDDETVGYLTALTEDIGPLIRCAVPAQVPVRNIDAPAPAETQRPGARPGRLATFVGSALRGWADRCLASPYGLLFTSIAHPAMTVTYTSAGETLEAAAVGTIDVRDGQLVEGLDQWLAAQSQALDAGESVLNSLQRLVFQEGQVVGVIMDTPTGPRAVRADRGVVLESGGSAPIPTLPVDGLQGVSSVTVALVTRAASRFARLELLAAS
jgi:hypothetical protein